MHFLIICHFPEVTDASKYDAIVAEVDKITESTGLNLLINNAGILDESTLSLESTTKESLRKHFDVNTIAPLLITKVGNMIMHYVRITYGCRSEV